MEPMQLMIILMLMIILIIISFMFVLLKKFEDPQAGISYSTRFVMFVNTAP